jgi:hypothetical protein
MDTEMMNTLRSKYFLYINLGTHYCDEPIIISPPRFLIADYSLIPDIPPSTCIICPVIHEDESDRR